jgi:hypothetical protein
MRPTSALLMKARFCKRKKPFHALVSCETEVIAELVSQAKHSIASICFIIIYKILVVGVSFMSMLLGLYSVALMRATLSLGVDCSWHEALYCIV